MKIKVTIIVSPPPPVESTAAPLQVQPVRQVQPRMQRQPGMVYMTCDTCEWEGEYESLAAAKMGLGGHRAACKNGRGRRKKNLF